ncbi:MAG: hypothetical protein IJP07_07030 [Firmicutes bacterium]|nr:hypothetical protein [Bacillota bacterium]
MAKNTNTKSFWRKTKGLAEEEFLFSGAAELPVEEPVSPSAASEQEAVLSPEEPAPVPERVQPSAAAASETLADAAARLAMEEEEKRTYAEAAVEEAKRAEAAFRRVEKEAALKQAEAKAQSLQVSSGKAQQEASNALAELSRVEQAYGVSQKEAEQRVAEEAAAHARVEQETAELHTENQSRLETAKAAVASLAEQIDCRKQAAAQASESCVQAEDALEESEAELLRIQNEGNELLRRMNKSVEEANAETAVIRRQISVLEERINSEHHGYESISAQVTDLEAQLARAEQRVADLEAKRDSLDAEASAAYAAQEELSGGRLSHARQQAEEANQRYQEALQHEQQVQDELSRIQKQLEDGEQELRSLGLDKEDYERQIREHLAAVLLRIDQAKEAVSRKKDQYQQSQKNVELATTELVRVNALAKTAREKLDKALAEEQDAKTAYNMAQRLRSDALAAKTNTDEAASQLLSKAESVLLSTIDSTSVLLAEKTTARQTAEREFNYQQELSEAATAASNKATAEANDMIVVWLAAEESFVKTTSDVEAEKARLEMQLETALEEYEDKQKALSDQVAAWGEQLRAARQNVESAALASREARQTLQVLQSRLDVLLADQKDELDHLQSEWDDRLAELSGDLERALLTVASCRENLEKTRSEQEFQAEAMSKKLESFLADRKELQETLDEKTAAAELLNQDANTKEIEYKGRLQAVRDRIDQLTQDIQQYKETVSTATVAIRDLEKAYLEAEDDLEKVEKSCADALHSLEQEHQALLHPITEARRTAEERTNALAERLSQCRALAEQAVRVAAHTFTERLSAVNAVSICKVENQIAILKETALPLQKLAVAEREVLNEAEQAYQAINDQVVALRAEEERINNEADAKYQELEQRANTQLQELEQRLQDCVNEAETCSSTAALAKKEMEAAAIRLEDIRKQAADAAAQREQAESIAEDCLQKLEENYSRRLAEASAGLPKLLEEANIAAAAVTEQQVDADEAEAACRQQAEIVESCLQEELNAPKQLAENIEALRAEKQAALNKAQTALLSLEEKQKSLQAAYAESCDFAEKSELAKSNVENYLNERLHQQQQEQSRADQRIQEIESRLAWLKEDAAAKERAYREAEKMLEDSSSLLQNASSIYSDAQVAAAKAQAELQSSQAAKETATILAQQASVVHEDMDKSTAQILMKAAEGLFAAVDTAEAVIVEKQAAYDQAASILSMAETELRRVRTAIGEAPAQLERSRGQWEAAESEYSKFRQTADDEIQSIRAALRSFLEERKENMREAEEAVRSCREEAAISQASVDKLNRQMMGIAAEISAAASEVQTIQLEMADAIASMELKSGQQQAMMKEERLAAQEKSSQLNATLSQSREKLARLRQEALEKKEQHRNADREYQRFERELSLQYQQDQKKACDVRDEARAMAKAAWEAMEAASQQQQEYCQAYEEAQRLLAAASACREQLTRDCDALRRQRNAALRAASEEKLRLLGTKTIERIDAEDEAAKAWADCQAKQSRCLIAEQKAEEIETAIRLEEEKLARIRREGEEALRIARTKTSIFA